jgi:hypothetical protein
LALARVLLAEVQGCPEAAGGMILSIHIFNKNYAHRQLLWGVEFADFSNKKH